MKPTPTDPTPALIAIGILLVFLIGVVGWLVVQVQDSRRRQRKLFLSQEEMSKEFKKVGDDLSKQIASLADKSARSASSVEESRVALQNFEERLTGLLSSLTKVQSAIPELGDLNKKLAEAKSKLEAFAGEVASAQSKSGELESAHNAAILRIAQLEVGVLEMQKKQGIAKVSPDRASIAEATTRAAQLAWQQGGTAEAELARRLAGEEGVSILRAFDASLIGDAEGAAAIIDASSYDPFTLHQNLWEGAIAAKRTLELARAAALTAMEAQGYRLDKPRVGIDLYDKDAHDLRDSYPTEREDLKGKIAEVRRPGLLFNGKVVRPARVVQYAIDYTKVAPAVVEPEPVPVELKPVETPVQTQLIVDPPERKGGLSQF